MGVPYSQEICAAVDQVAPLVAAVRTTKNIFILLAAVCRWFDAEHSAEA